MPDIVTPAVSTARYVLQLRGEQDEHGLAENVFRFQATLAGTAGQQDLCMMYGFTIENESNKDLCIEVLHSTDPHIVCKPIIIHHGEAATRRMKAADIRTELFQRRVLCLFEPIVLDIDGRRTPGTRLISSLFRYFLDRSFSVVIDLGTEEEDEDFNHYFFPDIEELNLEYVSTRLFVGEWGATDNDMAEPFEFGVIYS